jgi:uncharacterized protein
LSGIRLTKVLKANLKPPQDIGRMGFRIVSVFIAAFLFVQPCLAEDDDLPRACAGRNLLADLKASDPAKYDLILKEALAVPNQGAIFWKIEAPGASKPSWLFGTMHVTDKRVAIVPDAIKAKIENADVVLLELQEIADKQGLSKRMLSFTDKLNMPEGQSIWDLIPDDKESAIKFHPSLAMMPPVAMGRLQPWVLAQSMSLPICEAIRQPFKISLDEAVAKLAIEKNVPLKGLETIEEQVSVLSGMKMDDQIKNLILTSEFKVNPEDLFSTMVDLYLTRNITAAIPLMAQLPGAEKIGKDEASQKFLIDLIDKRNVVMADRARAHIDAGNAFIGIGALHLPGKNGVIELLRKAGYTVSAAE